MALHAMARVTHQLYTTVKMPKVRQIRKVMATVYLAYVFMRWKILRAPMMAVTMVLRPGSVSTMSAAPRAASVAPAHTSGKFWRLQAPVLSNFQGQRLGETLKIDPLK